MLPLVLMDALHLDVEHGVRIHGNVCTLQNVIRQVGLQAQLDLPPFVPEAAILYKPLQLPQLVQVLDPAVANFAADQVSQAGIALHHPAAGGDPVGFVIELLWRQIVKNPSEWWFSPVPCAEPLPR